jgi:uncharacterized protein YcfJ
MFKRMIFPAVAVACVSSIIGGCATTPMGPTVQVMPAPNEPFQAFVDDQNTCKKYAESQVAGQADAANKRAVGGAMLTAALGSALGAAVGGNNAPAVGAAGGATAGAAAGANSSQQAQQSIQQQYDTAYLQCMYSKGAQVPGAQPNQQPGSVPAAGEAPQPPPPADSDPAGDDAPQQADGISLADAQRKLADMGLYTHKVDGLNGPATAAAIRKFQQSRGLPVTGQLDAATSSALSH